MLPMQVGQATRPFGSIEEGVRVLVMCGRDEADPSAPTFDQVYAQLNEERVNTARPPLPARPAPRRGDRLPLGTGAMTSSLSPLAVSLGDPAGIGPEVVAKCWDHRDRFGLPPFVAVGDPRSLAAVWDGPIADDRRSARRRQRVRRRLADPADCRGRGRHSRACPASPARIARSTRWNWRSAWPGRARRRRVVTGPVSQAAALQHRLRPPRPDRVRRRALRRVARQTSR